MSVSKTKQEEIREGIAELYWLKYREGCHYPGYWERDWATLVSKDNDGLGQQYVDTCREFANQILRQEASQGVVIKVDMPIEGECNLRFNAKDLPKGMGKVEVCLVEPLIERINEPS